MSSGARAFWMLADDGGWPPEIDAIEGRGTAARLSGDDDALADSGHRIRKILRVAQAERARLLGSASEQTIG
jgi:hypothetical protein